MSAAGHGRYILYSPEGCGMSSTDHVKRELCCVIDSWWNEVATLFSFCVCALANVHDHCTELCSVRN